MNNDELNVQLKKFREGKDEAFHEIYHELKKPIYTIIYRVLYDKALAEDVMQELFLKLSQTPPTSKVDKPRAWIFKMAHNLAIDHKRKVRNNHLIIEEIEDANITLEHKVSTRIDVEKAIQQLNASEREIITLRLNAELKFKDIAHITNMPLGTVLWKYRQSIEKLRTFLAGKD